MFLEWSREEVIAGIEGVITVVFPCRAMKFVAAGFEHHGNGSGRRKAIVGAVIGRQLAELGHRLTRRSSGYAASAAAIVVLAAIDHEDIVGGALAIEADARVASNRDIFVIGDIVRCSGSQSSELEQAGTVDRQVRYLVASDEVALFPGFCLDTDGRCLNRNALRCGSHLHLKVGAGAVAYLEHDAFLLRELEPGGFSLQVIMTYVKAWEHILA